MLVILAIPAFCLAAVTTYDQFVGVRFLISFIGGSFVLTSLWTSVMFSSNIVGTANATTAGWGNLGGSVAAAAVAATFENFVGQGYTNDAAWRASLLWPPALMVFIGFVVLFFSDDTPQGTVGDIRKRQRLDPNTVVAPLGSMSVRSVYIAACNHRTWLLACSYAWCFGVEVSIYKNLNEYFANAYDLPQVDAANAAALFGLWNIFARALGGVFSDAFARYMGIRGRIWANFLTSVVMAFCLIIFASMTKDANGLSSALVVLSFYAVALCMTNGCVFGIVPFIEPSAVGGVSGIVGAGGNLGALMCNFMQGIGQRPAYCAIGWISMWSALLMPLLWIPGHGSMFRGVPQPVDVPEKLKEVATDSSAHNNAPMASRSLAPPMPVQTTLPGGQPVYPPMGMYPPMGYPGYPQHPSFPQAQGGSPVQMMGMPYMSAPQGYPGYPQAMPTY